MTAIIPRIEHLSSRVIRILGCNPGLHTLQGTNTYLIGTGKRRILIDAGERDNDEYNTNLQKVLNETKTEIGDVIITHWHPDHLGGVSNIFSHLARSDLSRLIHKLRRISVKDEILDGFQYKFIEDGHRFSTEGATLRAVFTPGHTDDHMSIVLEEENALFSGDCVLGQGTCVFEDLYEYMKSLQVILNLNPAVIYPGHGPVITNPNDHVTMYIKHRNMRESQIIQVMNGEGVYSTMDLVKIIYVDVDPNLFPSAAGNLTHHLQKLVKEGKVDNIHDMKWKLKTNEFSKY